jgi:molybdenum cofactor cytidylyltransferase
MNATAIVLAAGESRRMVRQKALLPWRGTTLIGWQLTQLSLVDGVRAIVVVTGHEPTAITQAAGAFERAVVAHNPDYATGKVSSILAGLNALPAETEAVLLLAVDQPRPAEVHRALLQAHARAQARITLPVHDGRRGHPVIFDASLLPELRAIDEASQGIRAVLERHAADVQEVPIDDPIVHLDVNTPEDVPADQ